MANQKIEQIVQAIQNNEYSKNELVKMLNDKSMIVRANAVTCLCQIFNSISLSFWAILALLKSNDQIARQTAQNLIFGWKDLEDQQDLLNFLKSESFEFPTLQPV